MSKSCLSNRGAALVEFAIVVVLLITLVFGIVEFGMLIKSHLAINQAAREGARTAAIGATTSAIVDRVIASSTTTFLKSSNVSLDKRASSTGSWGTLGNNGTQNNAIPGDYIRVSVNLQYHWITGFFSSSSSPLRAEMIIRRE